ncbi:cobalamin biosynthesis protein [Spongiactinospora sp. TRM90649]|uniref:cobalamin biosynthesis protein n=1 Tax=Spongiactinospora sp. TRM90649 TaxID=3031114 RepID=UPI0023F97C99|nr:cobalamin biosynthesis protein [Spongiactinospora sp. TRM90649]MDF5758678.1 cobalamin biosynthesis protein [Spongiactinospora sp. TRM90649]
MKLACGAFDATAAGIALGVALDTLIGDPRRGHPVALFGRAAAALEDRLYGDARPNGAAHTLICVGAVAALGAAAHRATRARPAARAAVTAAATWAVLGGTTLGREGEALARSLESGDLEAARRRLPHLVGRDPSGLSADEIARAVVESVAENTSDAVVAPLVWGAVGGVPGLLAYRAINTLDAMVGHRSPRYARFGWAAARLDDAANLVPARLTGLLAAACAPLAGGSARRAARTLRRDGHRHPSPNAGRCEAAFAGALGLTLGGRNVYHGRAEDRPELGDGDRPRVRDIRRAVRLARAVSLSAAAIAVAGRAVLARAGSGR